MEKRVVKVNLRRGDYRIKKRHIILVIILVLLIVTVYFTAFYSKKCLSRECFDISLARCEKAHFTNKAEEATWLYKIEGGNLNNIIDILKTKKLTKNTCQVYIKNLDMKNLEYAEKLKNKEMVCYLPLKVVMNPESNLDYCHGLLKEGMQDIIIQKMHLYIIQNIGEIKESLGGI